MKALSEYFQTSSAYWGENSDWLVVATTHRESDCLVRSNYRSLIKALGGTGSEGRKGSQSINDNLAIEEASHWAVGWVQYLIVNPAATELVAKAESLLEKLEDYPVVDERDFSELETEEADEVWRNCYRVKDRLAYIREHRSQFEFHDFSEMLAVVRGKYFIGYASELIN